MIHGLTDRNAAFPEIGQIRKGAPKTDPKKPGPDLDYFRFVAPDPSLQATFAEAFGDKPQEIRFISTFGTTAEMFEAWREEYAASSLKHRCDGRETVRLLTANGYTDKPHPCPGGCKQTGRLKIVVPSLKRLGFVTVHTTSIWDILTIYQNLTALEMLRGSLRGIPMVLRRVKRAISTPNGNGQRARREKWLLTIEAAPDWVALELDSIQRQALPSTSEPLLLTDGSSIKPEPDDENDEFEMMCDAETQRAIEAIWPEFGERKNGQVEPLADYLRRRKGVESLAEFSQDSASKLLAVLQQRHLDARSKSQTGTASAHRSLAERVAEAEARLIQLGQDKAGIDVEWTAHAGEGVTLQTALPETVETWLEVLKQWASSLEAHS